MKLTFTEHALSAGERIWLIAVNETPDFDARVAKVRLLGKLPDDFNVDRIDRRIFASGKLTLLGLRLIQPRAPLLAAVAEVISAIRNTIIAKPGVSEFTAPELA